MSVSFSIIKTGVPGPGLPSKFSFVKNFSPYVQRKQYEIFLVEASILMKSCIAAANSKQKVNY